MNDLDMLHRTATWPFETPSSGLVYTSSNGSTSFFNAGSYYGCSVESVQSSNLYTLCPRNAAIFMPAVVRNQHHLHPVVCDITAPDLTIGIGNYVDLVFTGSIFMERAFWVYHKFKDNDYNIVWTCMVQWLLWRTDSRITVYWAGAHPIRYIRDSKISEIIHLLSHVTCNGEFVWCTYYIAERIVYSKLVSKDFLTSIREWFDVLVMAGYSFPHFTASLEADTCIDFINYYSINFSSTSAHYDQSYHSNIPVTNIVESLTLYNRTCFGQVPHISRFVREHAKIDLSRPWKQFSNIILIVTFNEPHYEVIPYLEILYRSIFPRVVYCGPQYINLSHHPILRNYKISFVTYSKGTITNVSGDLSYECAIKVARMNFHATGYLFASDDLLLFPSFIAKLPDDSVWFLPQKEIRVGDLATMRECNLGMCDFYMRWTWWEDYRNATINALNTLSSSCSVSSVLCNCYLELERLNGQTMRANGGYSDIFYVPNHLMNNFAKLAAVFLESGVFVEIAIPTVLRCVQSPQDVQSMPGKQAS